MRKRCLASAAALILFWGIMSAMASPGTPADPLVTLSYITEKFAPMLTGEAVRRADSALEEKTAALNAIMSDRLSGLYAGLAEKTASAVLVRAVDAKLSFTDTGGIYRLTAVSAGRTLTVSRGSAVVLISGEARTRHTAINLTAGADLAAGAALALNNEIFFADNGGAIITDSSAALLVCGRYTVTAPAYIPKYRDLAAALNEMGLLRGTGAGYALNRPATRAEALYMMLYLLGEIDEAEAYSGTSPFGDVPDWARAAVAYAYGKGYTNGISATAFGAALSSTPDQYVTMLLRVMGYDDSKGDFSWDRALDFAVSKGMFTESEKNALRNMFYRDQMVYVSYYALDAEAKNGETLGRTLISRGIVDEKTFGAARSKITRARGM